MSRFRAFMTVFTIVLLALLITGCGAAAAPTPTPEPPTEITFQLSWTHEYSSSGFYMAEVNQHFANQNLKVTLEEGGFVGGAYIEPIDAVVSGNIQFGLSDATTILQARADGKPVVAIGTVLQRNPTAIIFLTSSNIQQPRDLIGKTVAAADGGARKLLETMLSNQNIPLADVNIISRTDFGIDPLLNGDVDALVGWIINEGVAVREAGSEPGFMLFNDYGIPNYATMIFTTEDMIANRPDLVERFLRATIAGFQDVIKDPEKATDVTLTYNDQLDRQQQLSRLQASLPLLQPARANIGLMDAATWDNIYRILRESQVLTVDVDVAQAYTTTFLDKIYAQ
jgi:NitT/TauT family transport system substrate-binding protein